MFTILFSLLGVFAAFVGARRVPFVQQCESTALLASSAGPVPGDGSLSAYFSDTLLQRIALTASTPSGYTRSFTNEIGAVLMPEAYLTFISLSAYNVTACAQACDANKDCKAFNIYFAREPKNAIVAGVCERPEPVTSVHCALYSASLLDAERTTNERQRVTSAEDSFERFQLGSNGYSLAPSSNRVTAGPAIHFAAKDALSSLAVDAEIAHREHTGYMSGGPLQSATAEAAVEDCAAWCRDASEFGENCVFFNVYKEVKAVDDVKVDETFKCAVFSKVLGGEWARNWGHDELGEGGKRESVRVADSQTFVCEDC